MFMSLGIGPVLSRQGFKVQNSGGRVQGSGFRETGTPSFRPVFS
jgi:hypothetical protein